MATAQPKTIQVKLTYDFSKKTITSTPSPLKLQKGELVEFVCDQGTLDLKLSPVRAYKPSTFKTGNAPVQVLAAAKGTIWCGGIFAPTAAAAYGAKTASRKIKIDPAKKEYGVNNDPGPLMGGNAKHGK